jgi:rfaE bifunctional protein kinase chain/domain
MRLRMKNDSLSHKDVRHPAGHLAGHPAGHPAVLSCDATALLKSMPTVDIQRLHTAIPSLSGKKVLVIGDVMLDQYIFGEVERISPEAPVPIVLVEREECRLGGASNVARNIAALGGLPVLAGILGTDSEGKLIKRLLEEHGINDRCFSETTYPTTTKTRIIAQQQQIVRIDKESNNSVCSAAYAAMLRSIAEEIPACSVIIVSDYGKGVITKEFMEEIHRVCLTQTPRPAILVDPKPKNYHAYHGVDLLTPNTKEAGIEGKDTPLEHIALTGQALRSRLKSKQLLITLGPKGMMLFESSGASIYIPTATRTVYDVTGAGDTVIAVLGLALAAGLSTLEGCLLANYAAGLVVGQVGAAVVDQQQLSETVLGWPALGLKSFPPLNLPPHGPENAE